VQQKSTSLTDMNPVYSPTLNSAG